MIYTLKADATSVWVAGDRPTPWLQPQPSFAR
jgi:hypothetical protein